MTTEEWINKALESREDLSSLVSTYHPSRHSTNPIFDAWFGVPESTSCWSIPGFGQAVDLLDDPPEDQEDTLWSSELYHENRMDEKETN